MPRDSRRLTGPEECFSPYDFCCSAEKKPGVAISDCMEVDNARTDGRISSQLRPVFLRAGVVSQARGSAYIELNQTKVICSVYGPREVLRREDFSLKGQLTCDFKFLTFSCKQRRMHQQDEHEKDMAVRILEAMESSVCLHKYPKSQINIYVMVLQNDGSALSAAILASCVALASAGIEMYDLVLASSVAICGTQMLTDPTAQEEDAILDSSEKVESAGITTMAFLPSVNQVSAVSFDGQVSLDTLKQSQQVCIENCQKIYQVVRQCLVTYAMEKRKLKGR
ncbi:unnamed protein product [Candidula unifasciata]|uniref:Exosome complex component MTR3 n=1 Tax=Candidula unifasciata TaxID=100452 RepID=A0A8S4A482_9EUPU|nr:unnamed protein product [Candidula unifasciata]